MLKYTTTFSHGDCIMAKLFGVHTCTNCNEEYSWDYHIPNEKFDRRFVVERIIPENVHAIRINNYNSDEIELCVKCRDCGQIDTFIYTPDNKVK